MCIPTAWSLPATVIVKKQKPYLDKEFNNELDMYTRLKPLQGKQIPVCYGEADCDGARALVLEVVGGEWLIQSSALVETPEEQISAMISEAYVAMTDLGIAYDDWKADNFHLVNGRLVFLDLEHAYELDENMREHTIRIGRETFMDHWERARRYYQMPD